MHHRLPALLLACCTLIGVGMAQAADRYPPGLTWKTLTSAHFFVHYHDGLEASARQFAHLAEAAHSRQSERLNWSPKGRTHLVVADTTDAANGAATPLPYNLIWLNATTPSGDADLLLNPDHWRDTLVVHEYSHILHLDRGSGLPFNLRRIFGRAPLLFPNIFNPVWMIEGLATYEETRLGHGGRGRSALVAGTLEAQALDGTLLPVSIASHTTRRWPGGSARYLYGVEFLENLAERHGDRVVERLVADYSDNLFPFLVNHSFHRVTGEYVDASWDRWRWQLTEAARAQAFSGPTPVRLTTSGFGSGGARLSPNGTTLAYSQSTPHDHAQIRLMPAAGGTSLPLSWRNGGRGLAWLDDHQLIISQPEYYRNYRIYDDLYLVDVTNGKNRRLTHGARLREPDVGKNGTIVAVANGIDGLRGGTALVKMAGPDATPEPLLIPKPGTVFAHPRISPDGATVAVSVYGHGERHIQLVDLASGAARQITRGGRNGTPTWGPWGRYLLYSADHGGRFNLYAWDAATSQTYQVTDLPGAALAPEVGADGITFTGLSGDGFDLYRIPFEPDDWRPAPTIGTSTSNDSPLGTEHTEISDPVPYRPYPAALPRFWLPVAYSKGDQNFWGAYTVGTDPLGHHQYTLVAAADLANRRLEAELFYRYDTLRPTIQINLLQRDVGAFRFSIGGSPFRPAYIRERTALVDVILPFNHINYRQTVFAGLELTDTRDSCGCYIKPDTTTYLRLGAGHNDAQRYGYSISPVDGQKIDLTSEIALPVGGTRLKGSATALHVQRFQRLPWRHHVASLAFSGVTTSGGVRVRLGDTPRTNETAFARELSLPGYPNNAFRGTRAGRLILSYRLPLGVPEKGLSVLPLFVEKFHAKLFAQGAKIRTSDDRIRGAASFGAELGSDMAIGYFIPLTLKLGLAQGTGPRGETQLYLLVESQLGI